MTFDEAFDKVIGHEGGYVNHPADPGGETKFGITKRSYPNEDIKGMTLDRARVIYRRDFWNTAGCDAVPDAIKFSLFDMAVNSGVRQAIKTLQRAAGVDDDGVLGPRTIQAASAIYSARLVARFNGHRLELMAGLSNWPAFSRGWARRVASILKDA